MSLLAAFAFLPCGAFGQASIQGLVLDPSGAAVPDASIAATLDATGATRNARTGSDGRYRLPALSIGTTPSVARSPAFSAPKCRSLPRPQSNLGTDHPA